MDNFEKVYLNTINQNIFSTILKRRQQKKQQIFNNKNNLIKKFIKTNNIVFDKNNKVYNANDDVKIIDNILTNQGIIPFKFGLVDGDFDCSGCKKLKSLKNLPDKIKGNLNISNCYNLKDVTELYNIQIKGEIIANDLNLKKFRNQLDFLTLSRLKKVESHTKQTIQNLEILVKQGNPQAEYNLGLCYYKGQGVERDYNKAVKLFKKSAQKNNKRAQSWLGWCYYSGKGIENNINKAIQLWKKASDQGLPQAMFYLGSCYFNGEGVQQDYNKATDLFIKASEKNNTKAMFYLGYCYYKGFGVQKNEEKAIDLMKQAADKGEQAAIQLINQLNKN